jgi:hypothetical protein
MLFKKNIISTGNFYYCNIRHSKKENTALADVRNFMEQRIDDIKINLEGWTGIQATRNVTT